MTTIFGFGVDAGMGCVGHNHSKAAFKTNSGRRLEEDPDIDPYNDLFCDLLEENAKAHPQISGGVRRLAQLDSAGHGLQSAHLLLWLGVYGYYPVYFGYDAKGEVCAVYVRFIDIEASYREQD